MSSFNQQVCFHTSITLCQLKEEISYFSTEKLVSITQEQNIICSKTHVASNTQEQFVVSYLQVIWWALGQNKRRENATNDNTYQSLLQMSHGMLTSRRTPV